MEPTSVPSPTPPVYRSFREFYPFYLGEHSNPLNRFLHVLGTGLLLLWLLFCLAVGRPLFLLGLPVIGYGFAWVGHFFVERNRPATFRYPIYSLMGDFRLFYDVLKHRRVLFERESAS